MRKEKNVKNRAMRRKMLKKSGKKLLAAALSAAMLSMGIYPAGFLICKNERGTVPEGTGSDPAD